MNKWIMLLCAGLLVVMIGCGPKDPAAEGGDAPSVDKPEGDADKAQGDVTPPADEKKPDEAPVTTPEEKKPGEPVSAEGAPKPEEVTGGPKATEPAPETK